LSEAFPLQVNTTSNEQQSFAEERKRRRYSRAQSLGVTCPRCKSNEVLCYGKRYNKSVRSKNTIVSLVAYTSRMTTRKKSLTRMRYLAHGLVGTRYGLSQSDTALVSLQCIT